MGMFDAFLAATDTVESAPESRVETELEKKLQLMLDLVLRERECAKALDTVGLAAVTQEKEALSQEIEALDASGFDNLELARRVREENRRNAYLFWVGLNLVRETMGFFEQQVPASAYSASGTVAQAQQGGKLLTGRI